MHLHCPPGVGKFMVHRRCEQLIGCLQKYRYDGSARPLKDGSDHVPDALRYMVLNLDFGYRTRMGWYI